MSKNKTVFICSNCGYKTPKWMGKCPSCGQWDTLKESVEESSKKINVVNSPLFTMDEIAESSAERIKLNIGDMDRVLGGGIVKGSLILMGGEPGIGKSTLSLQIAAALEGKIIYFSGEESPSQIKTRAQRLNIKNSNLLIVPSTNIYDIRHYLEQENPSLIIVDSLQTVEGEEGLSVGGVAILRAAILNLMKMAKQTNVPIIVIGHITKEGAIAGPKTVEHMVDVVVYIEGDTHNFYRIARTIKNRFGSTSEIAIFEMTGKGLIPIKDAEGFFLENRKEVMAGFVNVCSMEGSRPIFMHVESLATYSRYGVPLRNATGVNNRKLTMILAVIDKYLNIQTGSYDIFCNIPGGMATNDTGIDLGVGVSIISSIKNIPVFPQAIFIGELGLTGEIRPVWRIKDRIKESYNRGFRTIIAPYVKTDVEYIKVKHISDILNIKEEWRK